MMYRPCANQSCFLKVPPPYTDIGLCLYCRMNWYEKGIPTGGFIPSDALRAIAQQTLDHLRLTQSDLSAAVRLARGTRHREGDWSDRPIYSYNLLMARPRPAPTRRLPHFLIGRRQPPNAKSIMVAALHYHIAINHLGVGPRYARWLCGASFMTRRNLIRPAGELGSLKGQTVQRNYRLERTDLEVIGTSILKIAKTLGVNREIGQRATVMYLLGVEAGTYHRSVIVPRKAQATTGPGDHPLDHYLPDRVSWSPRWGHGLRRVSGKIGGEWPTGLDVPLDERTGNRLNQIIFNANKPKTYKPDPAATSWLFNT